MSNIGVLRRSLVLALAVALSGACSDGPKTGAPSQAGRPAINPASAPLAVAAAPDGDAGSALVWPDRSWAAATLVGPWAQCTVSPEGASNDPTRTRTIQAAEDGYVRFHLPPPDWGTKFTIDCNINGRSQGHYAIDLNDPTTFTRQSGSALEPKIVRTQPAFSGDVSAISQDDLFRQGYPARPDPTSAPSSRCASAFGVVT
jgi:hypothetical protein